MVNHQQVDSQEAGREPVGHTSAAEVHQGGASNQKERKIKPTSEVNTNE